MEERWPVAEPRESSGPLCASRKMERNEESVSDWTMADVPTAQAPLISVIVLYFRRRDTIEKVICSILCQDFPRREIVVVDNHSEDDVQTILEKFGDSIRLITLSENVGACAGRNAGILAAKGDILVIFDDDTCFASPHELRKIANIFRCRPSVHVLAFKICDPKTGELRLREWCHPRYWKDFGEREFETDWFGEGASAFRRETFERCGKFYEPLFYGAEGGDFTIRLFNQGLRILYAPQVRVYHWASELGRTSARQYYYYTRNYIWLACKNYRFLDGARFLAPKMLMMFWFAVRTKDLLPFLRGLWDGVRGLKRIHLDRTVATKAALKYQSELRKNRPHLLARLARHRKGPQL